MWIIPLCSTSHSKCSHLETFWVAVSQGLCSSNSHVGLPWWLRRLSVCLQCGRPGFNPWVRKIPWRKKWQPTPVLLPRKSHGRRSLVQATVHGVAKSRTWLSDFTHTLPLLYKAYRFDYVPFVYFCFFSFVLETDLRKLRYGLCQKMFCLCCLLGIYIKETWNLFMEYVEWGLSHRKN